METGCRNGYSPMNGANDSQKGVELTVADDEAVDIRRRFGQEIAMQLLPFVSWGDFEEILQKIKVEAAGEQDLDKKNTTDDLTDSGSDDDLY